MPTHKSNDCPLRVTAVQYYLVKIRHKKKCNALG